MKFFISGSAFFTLLLQLNAFQTPLQKKGFYAKLTFTTTKTCTNPFIPSSSTCLYNVPPPSLDDEEAIKDASDRESPPQSFYELQLNSARAAQLAINDGYKLLEVEVSS